MNEPREWIFHPLSTWPVLCNGGGLFRWQVGHISVAYFFFSCHQYLFLLLFYRIAVSWLSYSVSAWSLGQHVCRFSPAIAHLSSFWCFGNLQNHPVSLKIYASLLIANSKSVMKIFLFFFFYFINKKTDLKEVKHIEDQVYFSTNLRINSLGWPRVAGQYSWPSWWEWVGKNTHWSLWGSPPQSERLEKAILHTLY